MAKYTKKFRVTTNGEEYRVEVKVMDGIIPFVYTWKHYKGAKSVDSVIQPIIPI